MDINTNINRLRYFQSVCKNMSITKASLELNIAQPSVTIAIKDLERELGVELFNRKNNKLSLTEEGTIILAKSNRLLLDINTFFSEIVDMGEYANYKVRLGVPPIMGTILMPKIYSEIMKRCPSIDLELCECTFMQAIQHLEDNILDLTILLDYDIPKNYNYKIFYETDIQFCVSKSNPIANKQYVTCEDLKDFPLTILASGSFHHTAITKLFKDAKVTPRIISQSLELLTIIQFIEDFQMGTITYKDLFKNNPNIVTIPWETPMEVKLCVAWKKDKYISQANKEVVKFLTTYDWTA